MKTLVHGNPQLVHPWQFVLFSFETHDVCWAQSFQYRSTYKMRQETWDFGSFFWANWYNREWERNYPLIQECVGSLCFLGKVSYIFTAQVPSSVVSITVILAEASPRQSLPGPCLYCELGNRRSQLILTIAARSEDNGRHDTSWYFGDCLNELSSRLQIRRTHEDRWLIALRRPKLRRFRRCSGPYVDFAIGHPGLITAGVFKNDTTCPISEIYLKY
jgi:hypothetical protein